MAQNWAACSGRCKAEQPGADGTYGPPRLRPAPANARAICTTTPHTSANEKLMKPPGLEAATSRPSGARGQDGPIAMRSSWGMRQAIRAAPARQARPPETTENWGPARAATAPDSASPRRGPPVTTAMWIAASRPRSPSGTVSCRIALRNTAEMTSAAPATASRTSASGNQHGTTLPANAADPAGRERPQQRTSPWRGVQQPDRARAAVEHPGPQRREQRPRHAEDHRVQVDEEG